MEEPKKRPFLETCIVCKAAPHKRCISLYTRRFVRCHWQRGSWIIKYDLLYRELPRKQQFFMQNSEEF